MGDKGTFHIDDLYTVVIPIPRGSRWVVKHFRRWSEWKLMAANVICEKTAKIGRLGQLQKARSLSCVGRLTPGLRRCASSNLRYIKKLWSPILDDVYFLYRSASNPRKNLNSSAQSVLRLFSCYLFRQCKWPPDYPFSKTPSYSGDSRKKRLKKNRSRAIHAKSNLCAFLVRSNYKLHNI